MNEKLIECLEYCKGQIESSDGEILEGISTADIDVMLSELAND